MSHSLRSMMESLKQIATIIAGLVLTNTVVQFILTDSKTRNLPECWDSETFVFVLLVLNIIRFYHGNLRHLDETYWLNASNMVSSSSKEVVPKKHHPALDFFFVLTESLIFAVMSFYQRHILNFFHIFTALLMIDIFWFVSVRELSWRKERYARVWILNNVITVFVLLMALNFLSFRPWYATFVFSLIALANMLVDYGVNWRFYFPG